MADQKLFRAILRNEIVPLLREDLEMRLIDLNYLAGMNFIAAEFMQ